MVRVPRNKGSYEPRKSGSYQVRYPLGWNDILKKYDVYREDVSSEAEAIALIKLINDYVYHGGSPQDVPSWRAEAKNEKAVTRLTVSQFSDEFISLREKQRRVEQRTIQSDRECFARIAPYIGDMSLASVTAYDIDRAYACMRSEGPENKGGHAYSGTSLQKTHAYLSMLFDKAVDYDYVARNPLEKVERPKRDTQEKASLSLEQAQALYAQIASRPLEARSVGVLLCLGCGLRLSEMLALKWSDYVDGSISVNKSLLREKQGFKPTKTGEVRSVPCPPFLIELLADWREVQLSWFSSNRLKWSNDSPIVHSRVGNHVLQRSFSKWFARARIDFPVPDDFTVHGLRHTYVTLLNRDCGTDSRTTQSMSGHKTDQAFAIYTHTNEEWQRKAALRLGNVIAPSGESIFCQNCKLWTMSPNDATKGACWSEGDIPIATGAVDRCHTGRFSIRSSAV